MLFLFSIGELIAASCPRHPCSLCPWGRWWSPRSCNCAPWCRPCYFQVPDEPWSSEPSCWLGRSLGRGALPGIWGWWCWSSKSCLARPFSLTNLWSHLESYSWGISQENPRTFSNFLQTFSMIFSCTFRCRQILLGRMKIFGSSKSPCPWSNDWHTFSGTGSAWLDDA